MMEIDYKTMSEGLLSGVKVVIQGIDESLIDNDSLETETRRMLRDIKYQLEGVIS